MLQVNLKAVIFDMDDTLVDWSQRTLDWVSHESKHLERIFEYVTHEVHPISGEAVFFDAVRRASREAWMEAERGLRAPRYGDSIHKALVALGVPPDRINVEACLKASNWQVVSGVRAFPDALEILPLLVSHGIDIGMITNSSLPMWMRDRELDALGLLPFFGDCRLTAADAGYIKPHPAVFEAALERIHAQPGEVVFVGDNPEADVAGAQAVGMRGVLRIAGRTPPLISGLIIPDGAINTLHELLPLLDAWYPYWRTPHSQNGHIAPVQTEQAI